MSKNDGTFRLAVLIDGDNISHRLADALFTEVSKRGVPTVRRIYGDFSNSAASGWKAAVQKYAVTAHQHFANAAGKNGTDISLVIDAMDLLQQGTVDGICIASSDSDYTRLATRVREQGLTVIGFGKKEAAQSFRQACREFVEIDVPMATAMETVMPSAVPKAAVGTPDAAHSASTLSSPAMNGGPAQRVPEVVLASNRVTPERQIRVLLLKAFRRLGGAEWYSLSELLAELRDLQPGFKAKDFGSSKPITLVRKTKCFDCELQDGIMMVRRRSTDSVLATLMTRTTAGDLAGPTPAPPRTPLLLP